MTCFSGLDRANLFGEGEQWIRHFLELDGRGSGRNGLGNGFRYGETSGRLGSRGAFTARAAPSAAALAGVFFLDRVRVGD